ncbi:uncharacterized protein LOC123915015 [Trifolium pratense]|uniref:uncharacterized protein LOC123915015 n=1 Tax=Trifolium pratense TaxID=57577 RepID=UPI001E697708|nr:uncharacterized protein LOC123915015 [Trifolium pratense]
MLRSLHKKFDMKVTAIEEAKDITEMKLDELKQKKRLTVSWSDEDSEEEVDTAKAIHALTGVCTSDTESCDEELTFDELDESYRELCLKSEEVCRVSEKQKETITKLQTERTDNLSKISEFGAKCEENLRTIEEKKATIISLEAYKVKQLTEIAHLNEEVESLGGKKYVFVVVDNFSRYTWVNFIREKSETFEEKFYSNIMSDSAKSSPTKNDDVPSQQQLVIDTIPLTTIRPTSPTKKRKSTSKKDKSSRTSTNPSSSASIKSSTRKSKKGKVESSKVFTMSELHVDQLPSSGVATAVAEPTVENVITSSKTSVNIGLKIPNASTKTNDDVAAESLKKTGPETHAASSVVTPDAEPNVVPDVTTSLVPENLVDYSESDESPKPKSADEEIAADKDVNENPDVIIVNETTVSDKSVPTNSENGSARWKFVYHRRLALERNLKEDILECQSIVEAIEYAGLMKTGCDLDKCYDRLVKEFLINVVDNCNDPASPEYRQVFVRGKCVKFSPTVINQYLQRNSEEVADLKVTDNEVCKVLTGGRIKVWPSKAKLAATALSPFYDILNRIAAHNWVPTTHSGDVARGLRKFIYVVGTKAKFDYGSYFFHETLSHDMTYAVEKPVALPTLLCNIILEQHPDILRTTDSPCKRKGLLTIEKRLLEGTNVAAGVGSSVQAGVLSRKQMIADLTEASRAVEARKLKIDRTSVGAPLATSV